MKKAFLLVALLANSLATGAQARVVYKDLGDGTVMYVRYYANGRLFESGSFYNGLRSGVWRRYGEDGRLLARVRFKQGVRDGHYWAVNPADGTRYKVRYAQGRLVRGKQVDRHGNSLAVRHME